MFFKKQWTAKSAREYIDNIKNKKIIATRKRLMPEINSKIDKALQENYTGVEIDLKPWVWTIPEISTEEAGMIADEVSDKLIEKGFKVNVVSGFDRGDPIFLRICW